MRNILIKNMKMPEDGRFTVTIMHDSSGDVHWVFQNQDTMEFLKHGAVEEIRNNGRLIDTSEEILVQVYDDQYEDYYWVKMSIDDLFCQGWIEADVPTVVEE